jgi:Ankyrin repeats (many copies)
VPLPSGVPWPGHVCWFLQCVAGRCQTHSDLFLSVCYFCQFADGTCCLHYGYGHNEPRSHKLGCAAGNTALHWAAAKGHEATSRWLLQHGAIADAPNAAGRSALHSAIANRAERLPALLVLEGGASPMLGDDDNQSPRDMAVEAWGPDSAQVREIDLYWRVFRVRQDTRQAADGQLDLKGVAVRDMKVLLVLAGGGEAIGAMERSQLEAACAETLARFPKAMQCAVPEEVASAVQRAWRPGGACPVYRIVRFAPSVADRLRFPLGSI